MMMNLGMRAGYFACFGAAGLLLTPPTCMQPERRMSAPAHGRQRDASGSGEGETDDWHDFHIMHNFTLWPQLHAGWSHRPKRRPCSTVQHELCKVSGRADEHSVFAGKE